MPINKKQIAWLIRDKYNGHKPRSLVVDRRRLRKGEPLDYIVGWKPFLGCQIDLSQKPLIPRPETEFWADLAIKNITKQAGCQLRILDIFAGSGCVGIAVLKNIPKTEVIFAEKSLKFCQQIKINCRLNKISPERYKIIQSDIFAQVRGRYDYILANPPYIATKNKNWVRKSVLLFEPKNA
ncbi:MAG: hypothetical protein COU85_00140, partial [Candidatus Portnoybacteria bacterium CG10_big_fil_rev_8_21_14_0_10_44_7]